MNFKDVLEIGDSKEEKDRLDGCGSTAGRRKIESGSWRRFEMELAMELAASNLLKGKGQELASQIRSAIPMIWQSPCLRTR